MKTAQSYLVGSGMLIELNDGELRQQAEARLNKAMSALAGGRSILLCDNSIQPSRGELVHAAVCASVSSTAFAIRHTGGFLHVALPSDRCDQLNLCSQVGAVPNGLGQCVTVDAKDGIGTGISAIDRAKTLRLLASFDATADSFTRPGHVVPLRADLDVPASQYGYPEAALRLVQDAGLPAAAAMATVEGIADPTKLAAGDELLAFAELHGLPVVSVQDLKLVHTAVTTTSLQVQLGDRTGAGRLIFVGEGSDRFICLVVGAVEGLHDVPLRIVAAHRALDYQTAVDTKPQILVAALGDSSAGILDQRVRLGAAVNQAGSTIRRVLADLGILSVRLSVQRTDGLPPRTDMP
ncbi:3,4-dihydroxy-2-butanone-4-phosphate synthase [Nocardia sp. NPDC004123]